MSQLALAAIPARVPSMRWAHDIRNALSTIGLHLERLERLSGSSGREIAHAAHTLMSRTAAMCSDAMAQSAQLDAPSRRHGFDIVSAAEQIVDLLRPAAPDDLDLCVMANGARTVLADPQDVFRILFNLLHNAITVARGSRESGSPMTQVNILVERAGPVMMIRVVDDGPGLPKHVRSNLFRQQRLRTDGGMGLSIARELAERNGGVLRLVQSKRGATFLLQMPAVTDEAARESATLRSLGKRARH